VWLSRISREPILPLLRSTPQLQIRARVAYIALNELPPAQCASGAQFAELDAHSAHAPPFSDFGSNDLAVMFSRE
jgi:hypothetical protein